MTELSIPAMIGTPDSAITMPDEALIPDLAAFIRRYVVLPTDEHATVLALWALHTWCFESARTTPYLYVHSPEKQSGKTRLLEVLELIVRNPMRATNVTSSVLFRAIDTLQPVLLLDEVDSIWSGSRNEQMRGILNGGYKTGGHVWRIQLRVPTKFNTFCPKVLAGINNGFLPDTLVDRCIPIKLRRKDKSQACERFYQLDVSESPEVEDLLERIELFTKLFALDVAIQRPDPMNSVSDRQWEISEPIIGLAILFGMEREARAALERLFAECEDQPNLSHALLRDIRDAFGTRDKLFTTDLLDVLGGAWNGKLLGVWLAPYGITPAVLRIGNRQSRGYQRSQFEQLWAACLD